MHCSHHHYRPTVAFLLCLSTGLLPCACSERPAGRSDVEQVDTAMQHLELQLRHGQRDACIDYLDLCERASALCLVVDARELCAAILSRCTTNTDTFCRDGRSDVAPVSDAGLGADARSADDLSCEGCTGGEASHGGDAGALQDSRGSTTVDAAVAPDAASTSPDVGASAEASPQADCVADLWSNLEACGWPGATNTGPDPQIRLQETSGRTVRTDNTVINGELIDGALLIDAKNVTITNCRLRHDGGGTGGSGVIKILAGASATIEHVDIDGLDHTHACIWHEGARMTARYVNCHGVNDGIFSWAATGSAGSGDNFTIEESYFHDFTINAANGHMDGYQSEGARGGVIRHNTYRMTTEATSAIAIWNSQKDSGDILVESNLLSGGGATIYAEDYSPSEANPVGDYALTNVVFRNNTFSTVNGANPCVGAYFVWFSRPEYAYGGGPTDGWHRSGNFVLETGENVDDGNPHVDGQLCR